MSALSGAISDDDYAVRDTAPGSGMVVSGAGFDLVHGAQHESQHVPPSGQPAAAPRLMRHVGRSQRIRVFAAFRQVPLPRKDARPSGSPHSEPVESIERDRQEKKGAPDEVDEEIAEPHHLQSR